MISIFEAIRLRELSRQAAPRVLDMEAKMKNRVRAARLNAGMTQQELANAAGLKYSTLVRIDANPTARLSYEFATRLAKTLNVKAEELAII